MTDDRPGQRLSGYPMGNVRPELMFEEAVDAALGYGTPLDLSADRLFGGPLYVSIENQIRIPLLFTINVWIQGHDD